MMGLTKCVALCVRTLELAVISVIPVMLGSWFQCSVTTFKYSALSTGSAWVPLHALFTS